MDPKRLTTGQYLHTDSPSTAKRKPRRFTKPPPAELTTTDRDSSKSESAMETSVSQSPVVKTGLSQSDPNLLANGTRDDQYEEPVNRQSDPGFVLQRDSNSNHVVGEKEYQPPASLTLPPKKTETIRRAQEMGLGSNPHLTEDEHLPEASRV